MRKGKSLKDTAPFTAADLLETVENLRRFSSLMWDKSQKDNNIDYAIQYSEVVNTLIYGIYYTWEKYEYENGWIDSIAVEGEALLSYQMFKINVAYRIEGLLQSMRFQNIFEIFSKGKETNDMLILIYSDLLLNIKKGLINLEY